MSKILQYVQPWSLPALPPFQTASLQCGVIDGLEIVCVGDHLRKFLHDLKEDATWPGTIHEFDLLGIAGDIASTKFGGVVTELNRDIGELVNTFGQFWHMLQRVDRGHRYLSYALHGTTVFAATARWVTKGRGTNAGLFIESRDYPIERTMGAGIRVLVRAPA